MRAAPPIQDGEMYIHCPSCKLIGWTEIEGEGPLPDCPQCGTLTVEGLHAEGRYDVRIIDGAPADPAHHWSVA